MSLLVQVLSLDCFFWPLMQRLEWCDVMAVWLAIPEVREMFRDSVYFAKKLSGRPPPWFYRPVLQVVEPRARLMLSQTESLEFRHFMKLWHCDLHSLDMRNAKVPHLDFPLDCYSPYPVFPSQSRKCYHAVQFFPPDAPEPFGNALLITEALCCVKIFCKRGSFYTMTAEFYTEGNVWSVEVSPAGRMCLLLDRRGRLTLLSISPHHLLVTRTKLRLLTTSMKNGMFTSEHSFLVYDRRWDFHEFTFNPETGSLEGRFVYKPKITSATSFEDNLRHFGEEKLDRLVMTGMFVPFSFLAGRDSHGRSFLVHSETCESDKHCKMHRLRVTLDFEDRPRVLNLSIEHGVITDFALDYDKSLIYVVVLTLLPQQLFENYWLHLTPIEFVPCQVDLPLHELSSLAVYLIIRL
jgi:hypothetical protein